jgi:hypothetical protein
MEVSMPERYRHFASSFWEERAVRVRQLAKDETDKERQECYLRMASAFDEAAQQARTLDTATGQQPRL